MINLSSIKQDEEDFVLLSDLGIITMPEDFVPGTCLDSFKEKNIGKFYHFSKNITDRNFPNPSRILRPGDQLNVRAFRQVLTGHTVSKKRMEFLSAQKAVYTGAQGLLPVFEQKRHLLLSNYRYSSFDREGNLFKDFNGNYWVPGLSVDNHGKSFAFNLYLFDRDTHCGPAFFCFNNI